MGESVYLRTMAMKSFFNEGNFKDRTVSQLIELGEENYLRYAYYNYSNISFTADILIAIGIDDMQINKPGKDPELWKDIKQYFKENLSEQEKKANARQFISNSRKRLNKLEVGPYYSRSSMQNRNHGRFK